MAKKCAPAQHVPNSIRLWSCGGKIRSKLPWPLHSIGCRAEMPLPVLIVSPPRDHHPY